MSVVKKAAERAIVRWAYNQLRGTDPRRQDVFLLVTNRADQIADVAIDAAAAPRLLGADGRHPPEVARRRAEAADPWAQTALSMNLRLALPAQIDPDDPLQVAALEAAVMLERLNGSHW